MAQEILEIVEEKANDKVTADKVEEVEDKKHVKKGSSKGMYFLKICLITLAVLILIVLLSFVI